MLLGWLKPVSADGNDNELKRQGHMRFLAMTLQGEIIEIWRVFHWLSIERSNVILSNLILYCGKRIVFFFFLYLKTQNFARSTHNSSKIISSLLAAVHNTKFRVIYLFKITSSGALSHCNRNIWPCWMPLLQSFCSSNSTPYIPSLLYFA